MSILDQPANAPTIHKLADEGLLDRDAAITALEQGPDTKSWVHLADIGLAFSGSALIGSAIIYLVAFNWDALDKFTHFAMLMVPLTATAFFAAWKHDTTAGRATLIGSNLLTGALLALFGQTYQTGADPYQLFTGWAGLTLIWAIASNMPVLWALQALYWNVSLNLYWFQVLQPETGGTFYLIHIMTTMNLVFWLASELQTTRWLPRLLLTGALLPCAISAASWTVIDRNYLNEAIYSIPLLLLLLTLALVRGRRDPSLWAIGGFGILIQTSAILGRLLFELGDRHSNPFLWSLLLAFAGIALIVQGGVLTWAVRTATRHFATPRAT